LSRCHRTSHRHLGFPLRLLFAVVLFPLSLFFPNATATTELYTLSLHDALPISFYERDLCERNVLCFTCPCLECAVLKGAAKTWEIGRAPSELQSHLNLVCRLLLEKKNQIIMKSNQL